MPKLNVTHDAARRSFVATANAPASPFPIQNLPFGIFSAPDRKGSRAGVAIGDCIVDLAVLAERGRLATASAGAFAQPVLNAFIATGPEAWSATRACLSELLRDDVGTLRDDAALRQRALVPMAKATMHLPVDVPGYTDFYSSKEHATNVGIDVPRSEERAAAELAHLPVGYHGRASSIVVSGTPVAPAARPDQGADATPPDVRAEPRARLRAGDGLCRRPGQRARRADRSRATPRTHIFGMVLVNDWSARDIQTWEYVPLGPFLGKNFATSISPWVVTLDALEPFRVAGPAQVPEPLPYLAHPGMQAFDIHLEVTLRPAGVEEATTICRTNFRHLYWSMAQQLAHHTSGGCNPRVGDLLASGTISGPTPDSFGSLLELTWNGTNPLPVAGGETRPFLEDGDEVALTGWCQGPGTGSASARSAARSCRRCPWRLRRRADGPRRRRCAVAPALESPWRRRHLPPMPLDDPRTGAPADPHIPTPACSTPIRMR